MFGDFDEDEDDADGLWMFDLGDGSCWDCGARSDQHCEEWCDCDECLGLDEDDHL